MSVCISLHVRLVKAMVFPVVMYGCESWTIKKAEYQRIDAFQLWCWKRLLRVPWTARRSNQSILKEISPGCSLEGLMLKLKLQYFGHLMLQRADSFEKTDAGRDWGQEEKGTTEDEMVGWHHQLHGLQHTRTPYPSPTPRVYPLMSIVSLMPSNHLILCCFFSCPQSFPATGSFPMSQLFASRGQTIGVSASTAVLPMKTQD